MRTIIKAEALAAVYRDGSKRIPAVRGVTLNVAEGEWLAVTGPNGSGKSTLVRMFNGLQTPAGGVLESAGYNMRSADGRKAVKQHVQLVFQNPSTQSVGATPEEDIAFGLENRGLPSAEMEERIMEMLKRTGLLDKKAAPVETLSGGERQRLAVASTLALDPEVLLFDEATSMLDPAGRRSIWNLARGLWRSGRTVVWVTQRMEELAASPRVAVMQAGELIYDGAAKTLFYGSGLPRRLNWALPPVQQIGLLLQERGWPLEALPMTEEELEAILQ